MLVAYYPSFIPPRVSLDKRVSLTCPELMHAFDVICNSSELIPCRCVPVECSDDVNVRHVYENYGFSFFQNNGIQSMLEQLTSDVTVIRLPENHAIGYALRYWWNSQDHHL